MTEQIEMYSEKFRTDLQTGDTLSPLLFRITTPHRCSPPRLFTRGLTFYFEIHRMFTRTPRHRATLQREERLAEGGQAPATKAVSQTGVQNRNRSVPRDRQ